jgi:4-hydroxy-tetrahydrodipicolinate reductase
MASPPISVLVIGAAGKMGREVVKTVLADPALHLVGAVDPKFTNQDAALVVGIPEPCGVSFTSDLLATLNNTTPAVCIDFTRPASALSNAVTCVEHKSRPIIGATGLSQTDLDTLRQALQNHKISGAYIPNFAIGAVLLMKFAREASRYFEHTEIIELHHNQKLDAPSGTALLTAEGMFQERQHVLKEAFGQDNCVDHESIPGARGAIAEGNIHVHSVRLPGLVAHQEVLFGAKGQLLTLRHDSFDRVSFMPGVALATKRLMEHPDGELVIGLECLL